MVVVRGQWGLEEKVPQDKHLQSILSKRKHPSTCYIFASFSTFENCLNLYTCGNCIESMLPQSIASTHKKCVDLGCYRTFDPPMRCDGMPRAIQNWKNRDILARWSSRNLHFAYICSPSKKISCKPQDASKISLL